MQSRDETQALNAVGGRPATEWEETVKARLNGRVWGFRLLVEGEGLVLRGRTRSYYAKQLAQQAVMEVTTVQIRANEIEVLRGFSHERHDRSDRGE